jgi:hypothetical protein
MKGAVAVRRLFAICVEPHMDQENGMNGLRAVSSSRKVILALAALGLLLGIQLTGMSVAGAATSHPAIPFAQTHQAQPDTTPSGTFTYAYPASIGYAYDYISCTAGNHAAPVNMREGTPDSWVLNGCNVRVWLAQNANGTGYELCLSPNAGTTRVFLSKSYADLAVSTNAAAC